MPIRLSYAQIADDLAARIATGEYPPGTAIPSYSLLTELYSVSESTIARAVALLRYKGLVRGEPGRGVFVVD